MENNKNITEQLVSFETAKLAKEVGFDLACRDGWEFEHNFFKDHVLFSPLFASARIVNRDDDVACPTQSLLQRWLREKHRLIILIEITKYKKYLFSIDNINGNFIGEFLYITYEEALEQGLAEALKMIKKA